MSKLLALVVEDSAVHRRLLTEAAKATGRLELDLQPNAEAALAVIEGLPALPMAEWPDFAIVDIGLPGMNGIEFVDRIRQTPRFDGWPLIVLTASQDPDDRAESLLADATAFFVKPDSSAGYNKLLADIVQLIESGPHPKPRPPMPRRSGRATGSP